jgi:hypothetical protein
MENSYEELALEDEAVERADRIKILHLLGMLRPGMSGLEILMLHGKVCDDKEVSKRTPPYVPGEFTQTREVVEAMTKRDRAELRARVLR